MQNLSRNIAEVALSAAKRWPEKTAIDDHGTRLTFAELADGAQLAARAFIASGLDAGDRFAIWAPNIHEWIQVALGGLMVGGVLVPLNTRYKGIEAGDIIRRSGAKLLFTVTGFLDTDYPDLLEGESLPGLDKIVLLRGASGKHSNLDTFLSAAVNIGSDRQQERLSALSGTDVCDILYTSGTTGRPKGVISTHGQTVAIFTAWAKAVGLSERDRYLILNPFFHSFGYKAGWLACLLTGATIYPEPVFNPTEALVRIATEKISMLPGAPTIFQSLLAGYNPGEHDLSSLRCAVTGAASVPEQLVRDMRDILQFKDVYTGYGLTECAVVSICQSDDDPETIANTAGRPLANTQVKVVNDQGEALAAGQTGLIKVRGFNVMSGYFDDPKATSAAIDAEGWLDTGDIGWQNEHGYIKVTDRAKDMFICGGFNCYPAEIEHLLLLHPEIADVAVLGAADERLGEVAHAYIVPHAGCQPSADALTDWCREHMANYKVPRAFHLLEALPRNASGKVQKFLLKAAHANAPL